MYLKAKDKTNLKSFRIVMETKISMKSVIHEVKMTLAIFLVFLSTPILKALRKRPITANIRIYRIAAREMLPLPRS